MGHFTYIKVIFIILLSAAICTLTIRKVPYHFKYLMNNSIAEHLFHEERCACVERCLAASDDEWFTERFREDVHPLLSLNNSVLSDDIFKWWQSLQSTKSKANYSKVIQQLFSVIPGEERYRDADPSRCRTCAVVGNSGNLLGSFYGPLIDSHDFVMRMNKAPVQGYEKDVGNKTTHRIMYPESATHLDNNTHLVLLPFKQLDIQWITSALTDGSIKRTRFKVIDKLQANKDKVMVMHPAFMYYVRSTWLHIKRSYPSTGFLVLMFALHICDEVSVFGFGANRKGTWHHYFESIPKSFKRTGQHPGGTEHNIILELHRRNLIDLYTGWYLLCEVCVPERSSLQLLADRTIYNTLRAAVNRVHGDYGSLGSNLVKSPILKYLNAHTGVALICCRKKHYRLIWSALSFITCLENRGQKVQCFLSCLHVGGTIRTCPKFLVKYNRQQLHRMLPDCKTDAEKQEVRRAILSCSLSNVREEEAEEDGSDDDDGDEET